jgi:hypothetical protein
MGVINKFFGRFKLAADPVVTTQSVAVVEVQDTNTSIVLKPNGTGGIIASVPDGTATGGNARGSYSVDLQTSRTAADQVAGQTRDVITGGANNKISANFDGYRFVGGGYQNTITAAGYSVITGGGYNSINGSGTSFNVISGGVLNNINGYAVTISGGASNTATSNYSVVSGGQSNTASTNTHATVVGGLSNVASGPYSTVGGRSNTVSGDSAACFGSFSSATSNDSFSFGTYCNATALRSFAQGQNATANAQYSRAMGYYALGYLYGQTTIANGLFSSQSDAQQSLLTARKLDILTTAATTVLSLDGTGTTNLIIPNGNNRAWNVQIDTIAVVTAITGTATGVTVGDCYRETKQLLFKRIGGTSSIVGTVDTSAIKSDSGMSTASITISAGGSQQMAITFTGPTFAGGGSVTCRVVSKVMLVEVAY